MKPVARHKTALPRRTGASTRAMKAGGKSVGSAIVPIGKVEQAILFVRGERVILDADLAGLYGVETRALNQAITRNIDRFPEDFMFQLTTVEASHLRSQFAISSLRSQFVISKPGRGGRRYAPYAFTEHGAIMAANVLNSPRAVQVSVFIVRAFVRLRNLLTQHKELAAKLAELERKFEKKLDKHDREITALIEAIRQLLAPPPEPPRRPIGYHSEIGP